MNINISRIFLMLGNECNLQCKYCLQHDIVKDEVNHEVAPAVYTYIAQMQREQQKPIHLTFFGGEPLLFWKQIEGFVYRLEATDVRFGIITNGVGLTEERVKFLNAHNISVGLSWDGDYVDKTRGYDAVQEHHDLLCQIKHLNISGVGSAYNYPLDFVSAADTFDQDYVKIQGHHVGVNYDLILDNCGNCGDLTKIDYEFWQEDVDEMLDSYKEKRNNTAARLVEGWLKLGRRSFSPLSAKCGNGITVLNLDMRGNLYQCHNNHRRIGTIYEDRLAPIKRMMMIDPTAYNYKTMCQDCSVLPYCRGGCMLTNKKTRENYFCDLARATYKPLIAYEKEKEKEG